jgi:hypothetical protein
MNARIAWMIFPQARLLLNETAPLPNMERLPGLSAMNMTERASVDGTVPRVSI